LNSALEMLDSDFGDQPNFKTSWEAFKKRIKQKSEESFKNVFAEIRQFLEMIVKAELENKTVDKTWNRITRKWE